MKYRRYSDEEMMKIAKDLGVNGDKDGHIDANGVAAIWTWRIKQESDVEHRYTATSVRKRVFDETLFAHKENKRLSFSLEDAFIIPLYPKKIVARKK